MVKQLLPKSMSLTSHLLKDLMTMFSGLMSQWISFSEWMNTRASSTCFMMRFRRGMV